MIRLPCSAHGWDTSLLPAALVPTLYPDQLVETSLPEEIQCHACPLQGPGLTISQALVLWKLTHIFY